LPIGSFKAVADHFEIDPKTVAKLWSMTMKDVTGYHPNTPINPYVIVSNLPSTAFQKPLTLLHRLFLPLPTLTNNGIPTALLTPAHQTFLSFFASSLPPFLRLCAQPHLI
jgi:hypothetical protein